MGGAKLKAPLSPISKRTVHKIYCKPFWLDNSRTLLKENETNPDLQYLKITEKRSNQKSFLERQTDF